MIFRAFSAEWGEEWHIGEAMYYTAITFLTVGLGDYSVAWYGNYALIEVLFFVASTCFGMVRRSSSPAAPRPPDRPPCTDASQTWQVLFIELAATVPNIFSHELTEEEAENAHENRKEKEISYMAQRMWRKAGEHVRGRLRERTEPEP